MNKEISFFKAQKHKIRMFFRQKKLNKRDLHTFNHRLDDLPYSATNQYIKSEHSLLNHLCDKYGSDKGEIKSDNHPYVWPSHNYADFYELLFGLRKQNIELLIECGLGTNNPNLVSSMGIHGKPGSSLRMWRDYFPNAEIIGIDIDKDILFTEERIQTFHCDQTDKNSIRSFAKAAQLKPESADIIIDDGYHVFHAGVCLFENMIQYLNENGIYVIEDVTREDMCLYKDYFFSLNENYSVHFFNLRTPKRMGGDDNRMIVIRKNQIIN